MKKTSKNVKIFIIALLAVAILGCKQPLAPDNSDANTTPDAELTTVTTTPTQVTPTPTPEPEPTPEPTKVTPTTTQTPSVTDTGLYKTLSSFGFDISTEKVDAIDGQYQPKAGDITALTYRKVNSWQESTYNYTLDREKSTEDNLVYKCCITDHFYDETINTDDNKIVVNKNEKYMYIYDTEANRHYKFTPNEDGSLNVYEKNGHESTYTMTVGENKSLYYKSHECMANIGITMAE